MKLAWLGVFGRKDTVVIETRGTIHKVILDRSGRLRAQNGYYLFCILNTYVPRNRYI